MVNLSPGDFHMQMSLGEVFSGGSPVIGHRQTLNGRDGITSIAKS